MSYKLGVEERIVLALSRLNPSADVIEDIGDTLKSNYGSIDYNKILNLSIHNRVAPFLYENLKSTDIIPAGVKAELRNIYLCTAASNIFNFREMIKILRLLRDHGIEAIPLKGSLASEIIFGNPGLYAAADIDILVKPSDLEEVKGILTNNGFEHDEEREKGMLSSHYHLVFHNGRHAVEVHWNLVKRYFNIPPEFWWEDTFFIRYDDEDILCLSHEKYLMYAIFRLFSHEFFHLKFFILVAEMINKYYENIDWNNFIGLSSKYGMERLVVFTLELMNELFGTKIPNSLLKRNIRGYDLLRKPIIAGLFNDLERPHMRKILYLLLLNTPLDILKLVIRRVFPEAGELRLRYGISEDSKKIYVYYVLNPFLLPVLILKRQGGEAEKLGG